jgi:hypothetical protein
MKSAPVKRLRTNRKVIGAELRELTKLARERQGSLSVTAMCLGAAYALGWIVGGEKPSGKILAAAKGRNYGPEQKP